jgi:hypothetical protein
MQLLSSVSGLCEIKIHVSSADGNLTSGAGLDLEGAGEVVVYFDLRGRNLSEKLD